MTLNIFKRGRAVSLKYLRELTEKLINGDCKDRPCIDLKEITKDLRISILNFTKEEAKKIAHENCEEEVSAVRDALKNG